MGSCRERLIEILRDDFQQACLPTELGDLPDRVHGGDSLPGDPPLERTMLHFAERLRNLLLGVAPHPSACRQWDPLGGVAIQR